LSLIFDADVGILAEFRIKVHTDFVFSFAVCFYDHALCYFYK